MLGATVSLILLFVTGVNTYTLSGVIITGVLTTIGVLLFGVAAEIRTTRVEPEERRGNRPLMGTHRL